MDKEPEMPPRPSESSVEQSKNAFLSRNLYRLTSEEAVLWDYVPPVPETNEIRSSNEILNSVSNADSHHQSNILYFNQDGQQRDYIPRSNHLFKTKTLSSSTERISPSRNRHHLIDWNSSNSYDQNGNTNGRSNYLIPDILSNNSDGFNFQLNPLYHKSNQMLDNLYENNNQYAKLYWPVQPGVTSTSLPVSSPLSPISNPFYFNLGAQSPRHLALNPEEQFVNQQLIEKINSRKRDSIKTEKDDNMNAMLKPVPVFKNSPEDPKQIINLFDPLAEKTSTVQEEHHYVNANPVTVRKQVTKKDDIVNNNIGAETFIESKNDSHKSLISSTFECFKVERRDKAFNKELKEFCEHLKSLYITCFANKSSSSCEINSGLVYSPKIDIDLVDGTKEANESEKLYLYGLSNVNDSSEQQDSMRKSGPEPENDVNDEDLIIIEVRFHSLVYSKITGSIPTETNVANCVKVMDEDCLWFNMKFPVDFHKTVDMIITHVVYNVAETEDTKANINDFLLKLYSVNEFLQSDLPLSSYVHVQNCKKKNKSVVFELIDQTSPNFWRPFLRCESDTKNILNDCDYEKILPKKFLNKFQGFSSSRLNDLIDDLNISYTSFISAFNDIIYLKQNKKIFNDVLEKISNICRFLSNIETGDLIQSVEKFKSCYPLLETYTGANHELNLSQKFEEAFIIIIKSLLNIIEIYSRTFPVNFKLPKANDKIQKAMSFDDDDQNEPRFVTMKRRRKIEISQFVHKFTVNLDICTQVPDKWSQSYVNYRIIVNLFHGFNLLRSESTELSQMQNSLISPNQRKNKLLVFNQTLDFGSNIFISDLPRETRIEFIMIGYRNTSNKSEAETLATTFLYLYDIDEFLQNGSHILPWNEVETPSIMPSISEYDHENKSTIMRELLEQNYLVTHNLDPESMMLIVQIAHQISTNVDYCFPEIKNNDFNLALSSVIPFEDNIRGSNIEDSLYGFHGCNHNRLTLDVIKILQKSPIEQLDIEERDQIWKERQILKEYPGCILKILKSAPNWSCNYLPKIYSLLKELDSGPFLRVFRTRIEALQLLGKDYPDKFVRRTVVKWLNLVSVDELCDYLPQLVQSLRFETSIDSYLIWSLFEFSLMSARFCHYFYWQLKSCLQDPAFGDRCQIYMNSLLILCGERTRELFNQQEKICELLSEISAEIKSLPKDSRSNTLKYRLETIDNHLQSKPTSLPLSPSLFVNRLDIPQCSYFNSNSLPLKLVFNGAPPYLFDSNPSSLKIDPSTSSNLLKIYERKISPHKILFKCGDDLRKDMLVMQIISIINRVWLRSGLNLHLIIFGVLNSSDRTGMIEMVSRASTLREIQQEYGLTGNFKHNTIADWLKRHNTDEFDYRIAVENFIHSCAGYLVITYLLGICDRHNDNIMVTTAGNLFHIDFGKFFGDAQMMAGIKRDRVPFVFTADMAYVINEGGRPSKNYQFFVDLCCQCFSIVRQNGDFLLSLMSMMIRSGIDYLTPETIRYFHKALMPNLNNSQAKVEFNRLIKKALGSFSTQLNFFIHSIAQSIAGSGGGGTSSQENQQLNLTPYTTIPQSDSIPNEYAGKLKTIPEYDDLPSLDTTDSTCHFSFTKRRYTESMDDRITNLEVINFKTFVMEKTEKVYFFKVKVDRRCYPENFVYRNYKEFIELYDRLSKTFPLVKFYTLKKSGSMLSRANRYDNIMGRSKEIQSFLKSLLNLASEIAHSDIVYTFFHPILRDQQFLDSENSNSSQISTRKAKIKLNIRYQEEALHVLVCHARNLNVETEDCPDTYVKLYLRPDPNKSTKKKTQVIAKNPHPTFMESFIYPFPYDQLLEKTLEVSVWESDMTGNKRIGQVRIDLNKIDLYAKNERWYELK